MNLGDWFILIMAVECAIASVAYWFSGNHGYGIAFAGYTVANIGLFMVTR